jgi:glycosyltransferase involved in cell wall biosynthesis
VSPKILYIGPIKDFSGYAHAARDYIKALDLAGCNMVTRALQYDGGDVKFSDREEELYNRSLNGVDIIIQHTTPNETEYKPGAFNVNYFAWETDRIPSEWVEQLNKMDLVLVPCQENIKAARRSGVVVPIEKIPHTFDTKKYNKEVHPFSINGFDDKMKFLAICQYSKKKGVDVLLKAYLTEFTREDNTLLVLKAYVGPKDGEEQKQYLAGLVNAVKQILRLENYPPVLLIHSVMSDEEIERLYKACDVYSLPSRGEGWSITHFDALGWGLPAIAANWAGPTEFIDDKTGWLVNYNMSPVCDMPHPHKFMYTARDNWAEPHVNHLRACMREAHKVHSNTPAWEKIKHDCKERVKEFDYSVIGPRMRDTILSYYNKWRTINASN